MSKILVCLDLLKYPNRGLGRVSIDFFNSLTRVDNQEIDLNYLVPAYYDTNIDDKKLVRLTTMKKAFPFYQKQYDVCHVLHQLPKFSYAKAKKMVLTIHDLNFLYTKSERKQKKYRHMVQSAINKADAICFISEFTRDDCYKHMDISPDKITRVIYNGVGELAEPSVKPDWCPKNECLFSVGQFLEKKNFHVLLPFMIANPGLSLVIAGENDTGYGSELKAAIKSNRLENRVVLPGAISEAEKSYMYHNCKAFVFPSVAEGFGLPVIEAMKCGKPVFCSDKTSLKEIGNRFAFFWENFDVQQMSDVFEKGISSFNVQHKNDQREYASSFKWENNAKAYIEVYKQLLLTE